MTDNGGSPDTSQAQPRLGRIGSRPLWVLQLSFLIRAAHQVGAAVFLSYWLIEGSPALSAGYLRLVYGTGIALVLTEWLRHRQLYREVSGLATFLKLALLGLGAHGIIAQKYSVLLAFVLAALAAHAPKLVRHRLIF